MEEDGLFGLKVDFEKDSDNPERVFKTMTRLIESVENMQDKLSISLSLNVKRKLLLHEIKTGSLLTWLRGDVECPEDTEEFKKVENNDEKVSKYIDKGVKELITFSSNRDQVNSIEEIQELQVRLQDLALEADVKNVPAYSKISEKDILDILLKNNEASKHLAANDEVYFLFNGVKEKFNKKFLITKSSIESILIKKERVKNETLVFMIKKPDYIGNSMWEFKYLGKSIDVKISDTEWLDTFHERSIILRPGDSLRSRVEVKTRYNHNLEEIDSSYNIIKVIEIIEQPNPLQNYEIKLDE